MSGEHTLKAVRGSFIDVTRTVDNPEEIASALRFIEDGLLLIKQGKVEWFGEWEDGKHQIPDTIRVRDYRGKLIVPGFVDTHIHYPQSEMVGAYGEQLLEWLNKHTFPTERRYEDLEYAREMSAFFIKLLYFSLGLKKMLPFFRQLPRTYGPVKNHYSVLSFQSLDVLT